MHQKDKIKQNSYKKESYKGLPLLYYPLINHKVVGNNSKTNVDCSKQNSNGQFATIDALFGKPDAHHMNQEQMNAKCQKDADAWHLKQLHEIKQCNFFKGVPIHKNEQNSYFIPKIKTQDLKAYSKLKSFARNLKGHHRTLTTIKQEVTVPQLGIAELSCKPKDPNGKSGAKQDDNHQKNSNIRHRKKHLSERAIVPLQVFTNKNLPSNIPYRIKNTPIKTSPVTRTARVHNTNFSPDLQQKIKDKKAQLMRLNPQTLNCPSNTDEGSTLSIRRIVSLQNQLQYHKNIKQQHKQVMKLESSPKPLNPTIQEQQAQQSSIKHKTIQHSDLSTVRNQNQTYKQTINFISNSFLGEVDNYFNSYKTMNASPSKIQLYVSTIHKPVMKNDDIEQSIPGDELEINEAYGITKIYECSQKKAKNSLQTQKNIYER